MYLPSKRCKEILNLKLKSDNDDFTLERHECGTGNISFQIPEDLKFV